MIKLNNLQSKYVYIQNEQEFKKKSIWMMQVDAPGLCGVIFAFYQRSGEEARREFLAHIEHPELLGKAKGYRVYCLICRNREDASDEYVMENANRIASEMAEMHLSTIKGPVHLARFRDLDAE